MTLPIDDKAAVLASVAPFFGYTWRIHYQKTNNNNSGIKSIVKKTIFPQIISINCIYNPAHF